VRIAVAGGTGMVGRYVVAAAQAAGHDVVVISRTTGVNLRTREGLAAAVTGSDVIVDVSNQVSTRRHVSTDFFVQCTQNLHAAGASAGVGHLVILSIVGIDRVPGFAYYEAKMAHERAVLSGPIPASIVRATQFHEFAGQMLGRLRVGRVALVPVMAIQPVAARSVGEVLVDVASAEHVGVRLEIAGPERVNLVDAARQTLARRRVRCLVIPVRIPGAAGRAVRDGAILATSETTISGPGFTEWLSGPDFV
jgi:uncharacterized protein YbjT (DUF2867 family)